MFQTLCVVKTKVFAQEKLTDTTKKYLGSWSGFCLPNVKGEKKMRSIFWTIHAIDNSKKQIELTEILNRFDTGNEIKNPKRKIYAGFVDKDGLQIELKTSNKKPFLAKLKLGVLQEFTTMQSERKDDEYVFSLAKINTDTTEYVKPKELIKVILMPPKPLDPAH